MRHQHCRKPMANGLVMMQFSAMPEKTKRTSLTLEGIRILHNTSLEVVAGHLTDLCIRMKAAVYNKRFRLKVIKSSLAGFKKMVEVEREGGRPVNRTRSWEEDIRQVQKQSRQQNRFATGANHVPVFVPHTPGSELAKRMRAKAGTCLTGARSTSTSWRSRARTTPCSGYTPCTTTRAGWTSSTPWCVQGPTGLQISEKIKIFCFQGDILMNRKTEMGGAVVEREKFKYQRWGAGGRR